jgi:hypothetical protein
MPVLKLEEAKEYGVLPVDTMILIEVESLSERNVPGKNGNEGWTKLEFKCIIRDIPAALKADPDYAEMIGSPIWGSVNMRFTMHPDNKLRAWTEALLNMGELDAGFELDTDLLIGRQAKAVVTQYDSKFGNKKHQIDSMLPPGPLGGGSGPVPSFLTDRAPAAQPVAQAQPEPQLQTVPAQAALDDDPPF